MRMGGSLHIEICLVASRCSLHLEQYLTTTWGTGKGSSTFVLGKGSPGNIHSGLPHPLNYHASSFESVSGWVKSSMHWSRVTLEDKGFDVELVSTEMAGSFL